LSARGSLYYDRPLSFTGPKNKKRTVVRNVYTFNLRPQRVAQLVNGLPEAFALIRHDLQRFVEFLDGLATADDT
jgi:hypothetical protein